MESKITISGKIISELSEKIPSNIIALNELIKNSYDAGADNVVIILNSKEHTLTIIDDGEGMDKNDIDTLFHISNSNKVYGEINEKYNRYIQGSKGLGFLSVFKFGDEVCWETKKEIGYRFCVNYSKLINQNDISKYVVDLEENKNIDKGTKITIKINDYSLKSLNQYFEEEKNYKKIIDSFDDKGFCITLITNNNTYSSNHTDLLDIEPELRLYYVTYSSENQKLIFEYNGYNIIEEDIPFSSKKYSLDIKLVIFYLKSRTKNKIDKLYIRPNGDLTPLIYFNGNLFHNYEMFDPDIMKNIKNSLVLNQMIGKINIISDDEDINFNSDRTQLMQNQLTDEIKEFLQDINKKIQTIGSENKKYLANFDFLNVKELPEQCTKYNNTEMFRKFICNDFGFKKDVIITRNENKITFSLFGKSTSLYIHTSQKNYEENKNYKTAVIELNVKNPLEISLPSNKQIDLYKYIKYVKNSLGETIDNKNVTIKLDDEVSIGILPSITEEREIKVQFSYNDNNTGLVKEDLTIHFKMTSNNFKDGDDKIDLISIPTKKGYTLNYNPYINKLIKQLNAFERPEYNEIISCCLRSLFEISIDSIIKCKKFPNLFNGITELELRVAKVIDWIKNSTSYCTHIANSTSIGFHDLCNMLQSERFKNIITDAHLGAHKSAIYLTNSHIDDLGKSAAIFAVITNEIINNRKIK